MKNKYKNLILEELPYAALFTSSFICFCCLIEPDFSTISGWAGSGLPEKLYRPGEMLARFSGIFRALNPQSSAFVSALLILIAARFTSFSIKRLSLKGERSIPFFVSVILIWISAGQTLPAAFLAGIPMQVVLFYVLSGKKASDRYLPAFIFPAWYIVTGGFALILAGMVIFKLLTGRPPNRLMFLIFILSVIVILVFSGCYFSGDLIYPLELPGDSFRKMLFLLVSAVIVLLPVLAGVDFQMTTFISIKYATASIMISLFIASMIFLVALHESGFDF